MYSRQPQHLSKVLSNYLGTQSNRLAFKQGQIKAVWTMVVGPAIANQTKGLSFNKDRVLSVYVKDHAWVHELHMRRERLKTELNEKVGKNFLTAIEFRVSR
jgi:predicted nucleic acid-binding Zn ribbon protein